MNRYRECARNLWNVYFSTNENIGGALDSFDNIRRLLFEALVVDELNYDGVLDPSNLPPPRLMVVPAFAEILIEALSEPGQATYWGAVRDMRVGADEITLEFIEYFDWGQGVPMADFHFYLCRILSFPGHPEYEGRRALIKALDGKVFHDEEREAELPPVADS
jgi:hypothetical protein